MKRKIAIATALQIGLLTGCGGASHTDITAVSREDGSGTRGAFAELFGVVEMNENGKVVDMITEQAEITNSTAVMLLTVSSNKNAVGYLSMGALNDVVKVVDIDGVEATFENIKNGTYKIARPLYIATKGEASAATADFIRFILSEKGQKIVEDIGYISQSNTGKNKKAAVTGSVVVTGSSSVAPIMEKIREAYEVIQPTVHIELQQSDSTTGLRSVMDDGCDIGMVSRELKESELEAGLQTTVIAMDGIAVIVNRENPVDNLTSEQVKAIFSGMKPDWAELK